MKAVILILLFPVLCSAQKENSTSAAKPSTTACPDFKKKGPGSKADYFQYLRSSKGKAKQQAVYNNTPKAQAQPVSERTEKPVQKTIVQKPKQETNTNEPAIVKSENKHSFFSKKNTSANSPAAEKNKDKKQETSSIKTVEKPAPAIVSSEEKKAEAPAPPAIKTNDAKSEVKEKPKVENTKLKWKLNRMFSKKTRVRRHNNAKCPSF